ncbi:MAG: type I-C CRISPR-associated protein Cas5 [Candidatus Edwardsbacteria bacterium RIFOXYD12_FULL_50_11]|uniref:pre-crRNA processing endonuclease n=1 Tax=Candidatus Edwardsbacteria bacterium GWF2_54_11 TaxID=1817851 RepID=A0A1F5RF45_9BACT|nr:MAG: type I-C CRISPR-associated protein Cas5 [Candidatus Edwardsbacteria bacterium RifOxyC12_full_54_24]OGF07896.1 MAG: type I-C CRISPR-associated protein Cas5 [Candidatus Edwardsbacteria bacterium RifOxyA12_full_54_48]OGF10144.1 MAG: type I-C CRISPR-associated protein Cas5 [Candidatus Edwardsbacteria bacterium GWE2_54_12]OGF13086.1 MAG: type I-C CRISPR-associated protein Cas5 [Candidatus Edwardsbacteria bacterium GWF2_54_11]OGF15056.1 MAG: type I-C CRISPR-associated protein Cas5 [Candidatus
MGNTVDFKVSGRYALFTDPLTKIGGEKCTYHIPTYEALKGIAKSIYWKPTFVWVIDKVRIIKRIRTQSKSIKPLKFSGGNDLSIYTYLADVEYQVRAHFEWNKFRPDMEHDRVDGKHYSIAKRMVDKGGRQDIFLGTRECQGYVEPCIFGEGSGYYDNSPELAYGLMFHGFDYPDESGNKELHSRFWRPIMVNGVVEYLKPTECTIRKFVREMIPCPPQSVGLKEEGLENELD